MIGEGAMRVIRVVRTDAAYAEVIRHLPFRARAGTLGRVSITTPFKRKVERGLIDLISRNTKIQGDKRNRSMFEMGRHENWRKETTRKEYDPPRCR